MPFLAWPLTAWALDPTLTLAQYQRTAWGPKEGLPGGVICMTQADDGRLWLGTNDGLFRFDGVRFERIRKLGGVDIGSPTVLLLRAGPNGELWLGYGGVGAGHLVGGKYIAHTPASGWNSLSWLARAPDGTTWAVVNYQLGVIESERFVPVRDSGVPAHETMSVEVGADGTVWDYGHDIYFRRHGASRFQRLNVPSDGDHYPSLVFDEPRHLITGINTRGIFRITEQGDAYQSTFVAKSEGAVNSHFVADRDGGLWAQQGADLVHIGRGLDGLNDPVGPQDRRHTGGRTFIYETADGSVWVGGSAGLERYSQSKFTPVALPGELRAAAIAPGPDAQIWAATWATDRSKLYRAAGSDVREVADLGGVLSSVHVDKDASLWIGAISIRKIDSQARSTFLPQPPGTPNAVVRSLARDATGALWVARGDGQPVGRFQDGRWTFPAGENGFPARWGSRIVFADDDGRVWFGVGPDVLVVENGRARRLTQANGGPDVGAVTTFHQRHGRLWVGGTNGVALFSGGVFHALRASGAEPFGAISGIVETRAGDLWLRSGNAAFRVPAATLNKFLKDPVSLVEVERFGDTDGLQSGFGPIGPRPSVVEATDGRLWFTTTTGLSWIDPSRIPRREEFPRVFIDALSVDDVPHEAPLTAEPISVPELSRRFQITYSAAEITQPERIRFRYKLEGVDADWQDAGLRRTAFYNDIGPGTHRFLVESTNAEGRWNEAPTTLLFVVRPAWFQTLWFHMAAAVLTVIALLAVFRWREHRVARQVRAHEEARLVERNRIARDLHDTFLQSVQGLMWQIQALSARIPGEDPMRAQLDKSLQLADRVIVEGRDRVIGLRSAATNNLADQLQEAWSAFASGERPSLTIDVRGSEPILEADVRDEVFQILREALVNAWQHAKASRVSVELRHDWRGRFRVRVVDDGIGMPSQVMEQGRPGHWGLSGMRERAAEAGAIFSIRSIEGRGTTVELLLKRPQASR